VGALSGYLILDVTDEKCRLCAKLLAEIGAGVTHFGLNEKSAPGRLREQVKNADVLIESFPPGHLESLGLSYKNLRQLNPGLIMVSITPFGQSGPYKDLKATDLTLQAMGGWLSVTGELKAPLKLFGNQAYSVASLFAANGILLALWHRHVTGQGQYIDISILECVTATLDHVLVRYFYEGIVSGRQGSLHWNKAFRVFRCKDGYALLSIHTHWDTLVAWLASEGMAADLTDEEWRDREARIKGFDHIIGIIEAWALTHTVAELVEQGQLMHFPWAEVKSGR
jgi:crotonobetainyl-CoA:carnitine CoA-transferase CaiB-like acyl-CoA transferase